MRKYENLVIVKPTFTAEEIQSSIKAIEETITFSKGAEMGRFNMGSTVILIHANKKMDWEKELEAEQSVRLGEAIGHIK